MLVPPTPPRSGMNLNTRGQALRMFRRGQTPEQIAAALSVPASEVELLLKVHRIVVKLPSPALTPPTAPSRKNTVPLPAGQPGTEP